VVRAALGALPRAFGEARVVLRDRGNPSSRERFWLENGPASAVRAHSRTTSGFVPGIGKPIPTFMELRPLIA
jgi:hypothetical protein